MKANGITSAMLEGQAQQKVTDVVTNLILHLDDKKFVNSNEIQEEISNFLTTAGHQHVEVKKSDWPNFKEADFYLKFSFDGIIIEQTTVNRKKLAY